MTFESKEYQLRTSPNMRAHEEIACLQAAGQQILDMTFGEARLPLPTEISARLRHAAKLNQYGPVLGRSEARAAVAGYFERRDLPTRIEQIALGPGSKSLLFALQLAIPGDVILPQPAWNSYEPQAIIAGKRVVRVPIPVECGGVPDPRILPEYINRARSEGLRPRVMVLTLPDNPTGTMAAPGVVRRLCEIAAQEDLVIISDEIYRDTIHDERQSFISPASLVPDRAYITSGPSKSLAMGGYRIGVIRVPDSAAGRATMSNVQAVASEVWSVLSGPMQAVAEFVYSDPEEVRSFRRKANRLHSSTASAIFSELIKLNIDVRRPTAGFYLYPSFNEHRDLLQRRGVHNSEDLAALLLNEHNLAVLPGHMLGADLDDLSVKMATSLCYGVTDEEVAESLASSAPSGLPQVRRSIKTVVGALSDLLRA